jgi:RHS repeat-associated protein
VNPAHSTVAQPFTWNAAYGYEWDCFADTGLYHVGARAYDPRTARWLQRDPIDASSGDPNLYRYCGNDPINRADPSGLAPVCYQRSPIFKYQDEKGFIKEHLSISFSRIWGNFGNAFPTFPRVSWMSYLN